MEQMLRCWGLEKRIIRIRIIRMLMNNVYPISPQIHILYIGRLLINSLGAERWREASVELSDALIHITWTLLEILMLACYSFPSWNLEDCARHEVYVLIYAYVYALVFMYGKDFPEKVSCRKKAATLRNSRVWISNACWYFFN